MSVRVMNMVFERYPGGGGEMLLALALADHAHDDGRRIYPEVATLASKTRQSVRTVQYQLRRMEESGWLQLVGAGDGGRGRAREYRIAEAWIKGAEIAPFVPAPVEAKGCNPVHERVQTTTRKGAIAVAPAIEPSEPSGTIIPPNPPQGAARAGDAVGSDEPALVLAPAPQGGRRGRQPSELLTLRQWLAQCAERGEWPVPDGDPVHRTAEQLGLPPEFVVLAWKAFKRRRMPLAKRQRDWRAVFRRAVAEAWDRLWVAEAAGGYRLTTAGVQAKRLIEADEAERG